MPFRFLGVDISVRKKRSIPKEKVKDSKTGPRSRSSYCTQTCRGRRLWMGELGQVSAILKKKKVQMERKLSWPFRAASSG